MEASSMTTTGGVDKLALALCKAQGQIKAPVKNRHVDFKDKNGRQVKYAYADLADVIECVREPLSKNELSIIHQLEYSDFGFGLKTSLVHASGQWIETWYPLPDPMKQAIRAQEFGSALTYARRYSLSSLIGIASEEDDDGAGAADTEPPKKENLKKPEISAPHSKHTYPQGPKPAVQPEPHPPDDFDMLIPDDDEPYLVPEEESSISGLLGDLNAMVDMKKIPINEVKKIISMVSGSNEKRSIDLTEKELQTVVRLLNLQFK